MAREKRGVTVKARHKKMLKKAKGMSQARSKLYKTAKQAVIKAGQYAFRDRRVRKREFRALWSTRINAAARLHGLSYSRFMSGLIKSGIEVNVIAAQVIRDPRAVTPHQFRGPHRDS